MLSFMVSSMWEERGSPLLRAETGLLDIKAHRGCGARDVRAPLVIFEARAQRHLLNGATYVTQQGAERRAQANAAKSLRSLIDMPGAPTDDS